MEFRILGPLEVANGNVAVEIAAPKQRSLLVLMLLRAGDVISTDRILEDLWGEDQPSSGASAVRFHISKLRDALAPEREKGDESVIATRPPGYVFLGDGHRLDATEFEGLVERARSLASTDPARVSEQLREGLALWRGRALSDFQYEEWAQPEIARLEELRLGAVEDRIDADLAMGRHGEVAGELEGLVAEHPFRERFARQLMLTLFRAGRQAEALRAFQRTREALIEQLGVEPSPDLRRLEERILDQDETLLDVVDSAPSRTRAVRGYELRQKVDEGQFGVIFKAYQPAVGREVAVKVIRPEYANHPEFIRRFESEAQVVARLEHPHIIPLYDYWREPDGAYLVMRWLAAGSLKDALARESWSVSATARLVEQIGAALAVAHRAGVVHRDVKPANILLDADGNAYLSDFGIAKDLSGLGAATATGTAPLGSPAYMAPEQLEGKPPTSRTDVYSLGLVLYEALTGSHPLADDSIATAMRRQLEEPLPSVSEVRTDVPVAIDEVIQRATAKRPEARHRDTLELVADFRRALEAEQPAALQRAVSLVGVAAANPYKGLRAFQEADASDFFGREELTATLVRKIAEPGIDGRFLAVVGPSGSGKSSVARAGLLPALKRGAGPGSERWFYAEMLPGRRPLEELEAALLRVAVNPPASLLEQLQEGPDGIRRAIKRVLPESEGDLVLLVDQFEEVFTLTEEAERVAFLEGLLAAVVDDRSRLRVVLTLRADFYDRPLMYNELGELFKRRQETVLPLGASELERAISGPAERSGVDLERGLVAAIVSEVTDQPGALPLLQYALTELYEHRSGDMLTVEAYESIGGVRGALGRRAEELYRGLDEDGQEAARQLFLRLVTLGEGTEDTRRRALRRELASMEQGERVDQVIDEFGTHRLLSFDHDPVTRGPTVEVAHEALLREWHRLRSWVASARDDMRTHRRLARSAREWAEADREPSFLLSGGRLRQVEGWALSAGMALTATEREYVDASTQRRDELEVEEKQRSEREASMARRARLRQRLAAAALIVLVAVGGLAVFAFQQRQRAQDLADRSELENRARVLAQEANDTLVGDPELAVLLALEAVDVTRADDGTVLRESEAALRSALAASRIITVIDGPTDAAFSADADVIATAEGTTVMLRVATTGDMLGTLAEAPGRILDIEYSRSGDRLAAGLATGQVVVWDSETGDRISIWEAHDDAVGRVAWSGDGSVLVTSADDGTFALWAPGNTTPILELTHQVDSPGVAVDEQGSLVAAARGFGDGWVCVAAGRCIELPGSGAQDGGLDDIAMSADGRIVVTVGPGVGPTLWNLSAIHDGLLALAVAPEDEWRAARDQLEATIEGTEAVLIGHVERVTSVALSPDSAIVATGSLDGSVRLYDTSTGAEQIVLAPFAATVVDLAFDASATRLAVTTCTRDGADATMRMCSGGEVKVWDVSPGGIGELFTISDHAGPVYALATTNEGLLLTTDGTVNGWNPSSGARLSGPVRQGWGIGNLAAAPDGSVLVVGAPALARGSDPADVCAACVSGLIIEPQSGSDIRRLFVNSGFVTGLEGEVSGVALSPDGTLAAAGEETGDMAVWSVATGERLTPFDGHTGLVGAVAFHPDGTAIATGSTDDTARLWEVSTGSQTFTATHRGDVTDVVFSPDGSMLATASLDQSIRVWSVTASLITADPIAEMLFELTRHAGGVNAIAISPDGAVLASASVDETVKLWDLTTGDEISTLRGHIGPVTDVAFSPDGAVLYSAGEDATVRAYAMDIVRLIEIARTRVTRSFTDDECQSYGVGCG